MLSFLTTLKSYYFFTHYIDDALIFILQICIIRNCTFSTKYKALTQELLVDRRVREHRYILSGRHKAARKIQ